MQMPGSRHLPSSGVMDFYLTKEPVSAFKQKVLKLWYFCILKLQLDLSAKRTEL